MRSEAEALSLPEDDLSEDELDIEAGLDETRPRRVTPALAKAIAYKRDRRHVAEYPHTERRTWPKTKALKNQTYRRKVERALRPALGSVTAETDDLAPSFPRRKRYPFRCHKNMPLGEWVDRKLSGRLARYGRTIGAKIIVPRHERRVVPFLETLVAGRGGYSVELARRFESILNELRDPERLRQIDQRIIFPRRWAIGWYRALRDLFAVQPEWEERLRAWVEEVLQQAPPADEPAWRRIRRLRARPSR